MRARDIPGIEKLTAEETIALVDDILENLAVDQWPVPKAHQLELDRRMAETTAEDIITLEELRRRLGDAE